MEVNRFPEFSSRFRKLRGNKTQAEFAEKVGISRPTVGYYENGTRFPDAITLRKIAENCNVSADWLLGLSDFDSIAAKDTTAELLGLPQSFVEFLKDFNKRFPCEEKAFLKIMFSLQVFHETLLIAASTAGFMWNDGEITEQETRDWDEKYNLWSEESEKIRNETKGSYCISPTFLALEAAQSMSCRLFNDALTETYKNISDGKSGIKEDKKEDINANNPEAR